MTKLFLVVAAFSIAVSASFGAPPAELQPQQVARDVIAAFQAGHGNEVKSNATTYIAVLEKGLVESPNDPLLHFALGTYFRGIIAEKEFSD